MRRDFKVRDPLNPFRIDWDEHSRERWNTLLAACHRPTLTQSWDYAEGMARTEGYRTDFGVILFHDRPVGLVQAQVKAIVGRLSASRIHRGPVWVHAEIPGEMQKLALGLLRERYRLRRGRLLYFHPELVDTPPHRAQLRQSGFRRRQPGYSSIWIDLRPSEEELRRGLKQKWRNCLNQAERNGLAAECVYDDESFDWLVGRHETLMAARRYRGPSRALLTHLRALGREDRTVTVIRAVHQDRPLAGIMLIRHGRAATYLVGWTGVQGRALRAHHLLLWSGILELKHQGLDWLDLGGFNWKEAAGVARFKLGLGGEPFTLVGGHS
ncbi:MAG: GNAT family N-acetyltransferase [Alphaproteobacteria bacterium]